MVTKKGEEGGTVPQFFEGKASYRAIVVKPFRVNKFLVRPGFATLRGDIAQKFRDNLQSAWLVEEE